MTDPRRPSGPSGPASGASARGTEFAHASEAELARILDFYDVQWRYEPDTFPIGWNLDGDVVESFSPDFYLPDLDLYVELTTLKQKLVRKKNRKLRRLRELYPDVRIKLFYARDFRMLLLKFGRLALVDELTGTSGQATPHRIAPPEADHALADVTTGQEPLSIGEPPSVAEPRPPIPEPAVTPRGRRRGRRRRRAAADTTAGTPTAHAAAMAADAPDPPAA